MPEFKTREHRSTIHFRAVDEKKRIVEGIAVTSDLARDGEIIETDGIQFKLPIKLLESHNGRQPIGHVIEAKVEKGQIRVRAQVADEGVADYVDEAWRKIRAGLYDSFSIGWRTLEWTYDKTIEAYRHVKTEWLELSVVAVPADANALITSTSSARSASPSPAPLGTPGQAAVVRLDNPPAVVGQPRNAHMTIKEQIAAMEAKRAAHEARMAALEDKSAEEGRTFDDAEKEEHATLLREVESMDDHLTVLRKREARVAVTAKPVTPANTATPQQAAQTRQGAVVTSVQSNQMKGVGMARAAICIYQAQKNKMSPADLAREFYPDQPELEQTLRMMAHQSMIATRAAISAGDTTTSGWASQLVPSAVQTDFLDLLRPATILGRIPGLRMVPFNVAVPIQSGGGTYGWVGEAAGKPVTSATFTSATLRWAKAAGIIVITEELAKFSSPSAEEIIRNEMLAGCARFLDTQFVGSAAAVSNVSPAGILNGITPVTVTGTTPATFRTDMNNMLNNFTANNVDPTSIVILMSATRALALSLMVSDLGVPLFPSISVKGGSILGLPVVVSENVGTNIIGVNADNILFAEEGGITVDVSREASIEMETTPTLGEESPITTFGPIKSLWQNNLVGFRVETFKSWTVARTSAVEYISAAAYVP